WRRGCPRDPPEGSTGDRPPAPRACGALRAHPSAPRPDKPPLRLGARRSPSRTTPSSRAPARPRRLGLAREADAGQPVGRFERLGGAARGVREDLAPEAGRALVIAAAEAGDRFEPACLFGQALGR